MAIDALGTVPGDVVLELGFGPGRAVKQLASLIGDGQVLGIDQSAAMLALVCRRNRRTITSGRVELRHGTFDTLPWPTASVDKVLAVNTAYFFGADAVEIPEARRVLRLDGLMALYATDTSVMARWRFSGPDTHRTFDRDGLAVLLRTGGFGNDDIRILAVDIGFGIAGLLALARKPIGIVGNRQSPR